MMTFTIPWWKKGDLITYSRIKNEVCAVLAFRQLDSLHEMGRREKIVRKINAGIPAGFGGDLIMKHFRFD